MTKHPDEPSVQIEVIPAAPEQEAVMGNLLELYIHDFSELRDFDLGPNGRFGYIGSFPFIGVILTVIPSSSGSMEN